MTTFFCFRGIDWNLTNMNKFLSTCLFFYISIIFSASAQESSDSTQVIMLMEEATVFFQKTEFKQSEQKYLEAKRLAKSLGLLERYFLCEKEIIKIYWSDYRLDIALEKSEVLLKDVREHLGRETFVAAHVFNNFGNIYLSKNEIDSAKKYFLKSDNIARKFNEKGLNLRSSANYNLGIINVELGGIGSAQDFFYKAYKLDQVIYEEGHINLVYGLNSLGSIALRRLLLDEAQSYYEDAIDLLKINENVGTLYSSLLFNLGSVYLGYEEYKKSRILKIQSLENNIKLFGSTHFSNGYFYSGIAATFESEGNADSANYYFKKALTFETKLLSSDLRRLLFTYRGIAETEPVANKEIAINYLLKAIKIAKSISGGIELRNNHLKDMYSALGNLYRKHKDLKGSELYIRKAIALDEAEYNERHPILIESYRSLAITLALDDKLNESMEYIQKSLQANHDSWEANTYDNPPLADVHSKPGFLRSLAEKSKILQLMIKSGGRHELIDDLIENYILMDRTLRYVRKSYTNAEDKKEILNISHSLYEKAIDACYDAYIKSNENGYLDKIFYFMESSKASVLSDALKQQKSVENLGIDNELILLERRSKADLVYYQTQLIDEKSKVEEQKDSKKIAFINGKLFDIDQTLDSLIRVFENKYPEYYKIRYEDDVITLNDIQGKLRDREQMIEYFLGDTSAYVFTIAKNGFNVRPLENPNLIRQQVVAFREALSNPNDDVKSHTYTRLGKALYDKLLGPIGSLNEIHRLTVVPDAELGYLPFGLLLSDAIDTIDIVAYSHYPYLLKNYDVAYSYSATLLFNNDQKPNVKQDKRVTHVSFAPSYDEESIASNRRSLGKFRGRLKS